MSCSHGIAKALFHMRLVSSRKIVQVARGCNLPLVGWSLIGYSTDLSMLKRHYPGTTSPQSVRLTTLKITWTSSPRRRRTDGVQHARATWQKPAKEFGDSTLSPAATLSAHMRLFVTQCRCMLVLRCHLCSRLASLTHDTGRTFCSPPP